MYSHYYVDFSLNEIIRNKHQFGPVYWKCNTSILSDPDLIADIVNVYEDEFRSAFIKDAEWWERCKRAFKRVIIQHSRRVSSVLKT